MAAIKAANLALSFLLELCLLGALGYWGFRVGTGPGWRIALASGAPLLLAVVWGTFMAPKAAVPLPRLPHLAAAIVLFGLGVAALYAAGQPRPALVFGVFIALNLALATIWKQ